MANQDTTGPVRNNSPKPSGRANAGAISEIINILGKTIAYLLAFILITASIEFVILLGGFVLISIIKFDDLPKLISSPVFHGLAAFISLLVFLPWEKVKQKLGI